MTLGEHKHVLRRVRHALGYWQTHMRSNMLAYVLSIWIDFRTGWACSAISCRRMWVCVACSENKASATNFRLSEKTSTKRPGSSATQSGFNSSFFVLFTDKFMYDTEYISSGTSKNRKKKKNFLRARIATLATADVELEPSLALVSLWPRF